MIDDMMTPRTREVDPAANLLHEMIGFAQSGPMQMNDTHGRRFHRDVQFDKMRHAARPF